jgi:D-tyrosyl-tRNA(Tyr) deacylase
MIERFVERLRAAGVPTETGVFGARMEVDLVNTGPVTLLMSINQGKVR